MRFPSYLQTPFHTNTPNYPGAQQPIKPAETSGLMVAQATAGFAGSACLASSNALLGCEIWNLVRSSRTAMLGSGTAKPRVDPVASGCGHDATRAAQLQITPVASPSSQRATT